MPRGPPNLWAVIARESTPSSRALSGDLSDALNAITVKMYTSGVTERCDRGHIKYKSGFVLCEHDRHQSYLRMRSLPSLAQYPGGPQMLWGGNALQSRSIEDVRRLAYRGMFPG